MKYELNTFEDKLRKRTARIVQFQAVYGFLMGLISILVLFYAALILANFAPQVVFFHIPEKILLGVIIFVPFLTAFITGFYERRDTRKLTLKLEKQYPNLGDRLLTLVEISRKPEQIDKDPFSRMLAKSLEKDMNALMGRFHFSAAASLRKAVLPAVLFFACLGAGSLHARIQPDFFVTGFRRLTHPGSGDFEAFSFFKRAAFEIKVIPGDSEIARGSNLLVQASVSGYTPKHAELRFKKTNETVWDIYPMEPVKQGQFQLLLTHVMQPGVYFVKVDHLESPTYQIKIYESLRMDRVKWDIIYPKYTNIKDQTRQGWGGKMTVPRGTKLRVEIAFNQPVKTGWMLEQEAKIVEFKPKSPQVLTAEFDAVKDYLFHLDVRNEKGDMRADAPSLWIQTLPDLPPYLEVLEPQPQNYVFPTQEIPFELSVNDDYALKSVTLVLRYQGKEERIEWLPPGQTPDSIVLKPVLKLEKFQLKSRDLVFSYLEIHDNYPEKDPAHVVKSPVIAFLIRDYVEQYKLKFPESQTRSLRQHFEEVLTGQEKIMQDTWDYLTQPPAEGPGGWETEPPAEEEKHA